MTPSERLQRHALEGLKEVKMQYVHKIHSADPTMTKGELKCAVGLGISAAFIAEYWSIYVDGKPVHVILPIDLS